VLDEGGGPPEVPVGEPEGLRSASPQLRLSQEEVLQEPEYIRLPLVYPTKKDLIIFTK
jgi:hypothetical protein